MVELLAPGGNLEKLKIAINYGADAVYAGLGSYSLRSRSTRYFSDDTFKEAVDYVHLRGKKFYATANGFPFNSQIKVYEKHIDKLKDFGIDGLIVATPGVVAICRKIAPNVDVHLSTQANVVNYMDAQVYQDLGVKRIIAAREISLKDLEDIKKRMPQMELEIFIHGSMCFAYSGRCLLSYLQTGRASNKGSCANDCRYPYELYAKREGSNALLRINEDEDGTHIFNSKDLNMIRHLDEILKSGVISSLKIEGRTKSPYYIATSVKTYRRAIDDFFANNYQPEIYQKELDSIKNRGYTEGYLIKRPYEKTSTQNLKSAIDGGKSSIVALVTEEGNVLKPKGQLFANQDYELVLPYGQKIESKDYENFSIKEKNRKYIINFKKIITKNGKEMDEIHSGNPDQVKLSAFLPAFSILRTELE